MRLLRLLYSVKLTVILLVLLTLVAVVGGVLPQGGAAEMYGRMLPAPFAGAVLLLGLDHTFSSPLFFILAGFFLLNLGACTVRRMGRQRRLNRKRRNIGPDMLHLGILVLAVGALITAAGRREQTVFFTPGEAATIGGEYRIEMTDFEYQRYESGAPKDWISTVRVERGGEPIREKVEIEVNEPLRIGPYTVYQVSHDRRPVARFSDGETRELRIIAGHRARLGGGTITFAAVPEGGGQEEPREGLFVLQEGAQRSSLRIAVGETLRGLELRSLASAPISGLKVARDPGYTVVLAGFALAALGLAVTYIGKIARLKEES